MNFQYDALGRRVARTGTGGSVVYVQMDQQTIADYPVGGAAMTPTFRYVYASYIDEPVVRKTAGTDRSERFSASQGIFTPCARTFSGSGLEVRFAWGFKQPKLTRRREDAEGRGCL